MGRRRFKTDDDSRNSLILAFITLGEGWHNNHHRYMSATRQGFYWWEIDITYYLLKALSWTGFIKGLKGVPESIYQEAANVSHNETVAAAQRAFHNAATEFHTLRKVVPTAAAIAIASVPAGAAPAGNQKPESALHKDVAALDLSSPENPGETAK
jgi:stearoyl-CoA desaturase (delta-9 desaturase)